MAHLVLVSKTSLVPKIDLFPISVEFRNIAYVFLQFRRLWDVYIVPETMPGASAVPDGWVIPEPGKNSIWNKYLRKTKIAN